MTHSRLGLACVFALVCALGCALPAAAGAGEIVVAREAGLSAAERADLRADAGVRHERMLRLPQSEVVTVPDGRERAALAALNADPDVRYAEPVVPFMLAVTNDTYYDNLWALENTGQPLPPRGEPGSPDADMDVPEAWEVSRGAGQRVAVVDTGIQQTHVDLAANVAPGARSFVAGVPATGDGNGHGTRVAGVIAAVADNATGIAGVAPEAKLLSLKAFRADGGSDSPLVAEALNYAGDDGIRVVNLSFRASAPSQLVYDAIARHPATLYVVAAGNGDAGAEGVGDNVDAAAGGDSGPQYPCSYPLENIICVGATDPNDEVTAWSNYGATSVDLFAPGDRIFTTRPYTLLPAFGSERGTSMAAPMVAAQAALLLASRPNLTTASLRELLLRSVDRIPSATGRSVTGGRANAGTLLTTPVADADGDGVLDVLDRCITASDPLQADADGDGIGDVCDLTPRGDDVDGDARAQLDDKCPTVYGAEPDGCPTTPANPPVVGGPEPAGPPPLPPPPVAPASVASLTVKVTPKRCPRGRSRCLKAAKVTVRLTRSATASLRFEQRLKRGRRSLWRPYRTKSLKATTSARSLTLKRLKAGSYRVTVIVGASRKTKNFRV